jgi:hypothetical protein
LGRESFVTMASGVGHFSGSLSKENHWKFFHRHAFPGGLSIVLNDLKEVFLSWLLSGKVKPLAIGFVVCKDLGGILIFRRFFSWDLTNTRWVSSEFLLKEGGHFGKTKPVEFFKMPTLCRVKIVGYTMSSN